MIWVSLRSELRSTASRRKQGNLSYLSDLYGQSRASCMGNINIIADIREALGRGNGMTPAEIDWLFFNLVSPSITVSEGCKDLIVLIHGRDPGHVEKKLAEVFGLNDVGPENQRMLGKLTKECLALEIKLGGSEALGRILENMHKLGGEDRKWAAGKIASIASNGIDAKELASIKAGLARSARFCPGGRIPLQEEFRGYWEMAERAHKRAARRMGGMQRWKTPKDKKPNLHKTEKLTP